MDLVIRTSDTHTIYDINTKEILNPNQDVLINDHVWLSTGAKVLKGSVIPKNCVVGAGAIITKKIYRRKYNYCQLSC